MREPEATIKTTDMRRLIQAIASKEAAKGSVLQKKLTDALLEIGIKEDIFKTLFVGPVVSNVTDSLAYSVNSSSRDVQNKARAAVQLAEDLQHSKDREKIYVSQGRALELHVGETFDINLNALTALVQQGGDDD